MAIDDAVHEHDAENVIIDPAWVYPNDCYHLNVPSNVELQYQYYIEFTGMTVGVIPPGWTERYLGSQNYTVQNVGQASEQALLMVMVYSGRRSRKMRRCGDSWMSTTRRFRDPDHPGRGTGGVIRRSPCGSRRHHARLAWGRWLDATARASHPQGF